MKFVTATFYRWFRNGVRNPKYRWAIVIASALYLFSPIDISTDLIPVVGWLDDGIILTILANELARWAMDSRKQRQNAAGTGVIGHSNPPPRRREQATC